MKKDSELHIDDQVGRNGLEAFYDGYLRGTSGEKVALTNAVGGTEKERTVQEPIPGNNLTSFIDRDLQTYIYDRLSQALRDLGRDTGLAIAMDPRNGEVLSLVNIPSFDSNKIGKYLTSANQAAL